jgi:hypothetical protein
VVWREGSETWKRLNRQGIVELRSKRQSLAEEAFQVKSKANFERRQNSIDTRVGGRWQPQRSEPVLEGGNVCYEVSGRVTAVGCGGLGMLQTVIESVGLREEIDERLDLLRLHLPYHESDHVLAQALTLLSGGRSLEALGSRRRDEGFLDALGAHRLPHPTTSGDFLRRFDAQSVLALQEAINASRSSVWRSQPAAERRLARIDVDGTIVETGGQCKQGMDISYDGRWGFGPLIVSLANTQEVLYALHRPANRPSHDGAVEWIDRGVRWAREGGGFERVRLRGDTDFSLTEHFDRWSEEGVEFVFGMDANPRFVQRAEQLGEEAWVPFEREPAPPPRRKRPANVKQAVVERRGFRHLALEEEHVAEMEYRSRKAKKDGYRLIVLRKRIRVTEGQLRLTDEIRYFFYVTNVAADALAPAEVVRENHGRCHQENLIEQIKNGVHATRMPVAEFDANWAYLVIACLAWSLKAWAGLLLPRELGARAILRMEFRRFLDEIVLLPAQILRTGRRLVFRLLAINRWVPLLLEGTQRLKRRCLA